jgi:hypothetical protein
MLSPTMQQALSYIADCECNDLGGMYVASAPAFVLSALNREWGSLTYVEQCDIVALLVRAEQAFSVECDELEQYHNRVSVVTDYHVICDCCCRMAGDAGQQPDIDAAMVRLAQVGWQWVDSERGQQCWCPTCLAKALPANDSEAA